MSISSRAKRKILEGSETRDTKVSPEHPPLIKSDDIVRSLWKHKKIGYSRILIQMFVMGLLFLVVTLNQ